MPLYKHISTMVKATGLIFFYHCQCCFSPRSAFWHAPVRMMHSSWTNQCPFLCSMHLCWQGKCWFGGFTWWLPLYFSYWLLWFCSCSSNTSQLNITYFTILCRGSRECSVGIYTILKVLYCELISCATPACFSTFLNLCHVLTLVENS